MQGFEERKLKLEAQAVGPEIEVMTLRECMALPKTDTSEKRLERLAAGTQFVPLFERITLELQKEAKLTTRLMPQPDEIPQLDSRYFQYSDTLSDCRERFLKGENLLISAVIEEGHIIAFAIASRAERGSWRVEIVDVHEYARRYSGLEINLDLHGENFGVGAGHLVVHVLISQLPGQILVDATNSLSRYIFKSLGFVQVEGDSNRCHLLRFQLS